MRRFENILAVYHDDIGADEVFSKSVSLARTNGAELTLIDVVQDRFATIAGVKERQKRLRRLIPAIHAEGVDNARVIVRSGTPFLEIVREVLRQNHDLVITSAESSAGLRNFYPGSTTTHLVRKCPCPVWIIKRSQKTRYTRILACADPKSQNTSDLELDIKIIELARSLSESNAAALHVVHAWEVGGYDHERLESELHDSFRAEILAKHESVHRDRIKALLDAAPLSGINHKLHLPRATPHRAIVNLVDELNIDLVVMGSVNRTGISGFFIGSAAETVLASIRCGLFTVKPECFRTPIVVEEASLRTASKT